MKNYMVKLYKNSNGTKTLEQAEMVKAQNKTDAIIMISRQIRTTRRIPYPIYTFEAEILKGGN